MSNKDRALSEIEFEALANLRYRIRKFRQFSAKAADKLGLTGQQHQALLAIKGLGIGDRMSLSDLADKLFLTPDEAAELAASLQEAGHVTIETKHKRRPAVMLTAQAEELLHRLTSAHLYEIREMAPELMQALRMLGDHRQMEVAAWMQ
ncbi:DNA-binding MarR family transcriptional regulator [Rhizobium sp. BK275]|uniref:MarR family transcriptional regulator n=1 Tax=unclassified Rhizobium TaxID=2613769 RepID=UPI00161B316B|nr:MULTISPECIES: helix-turn-helix domain-containing protein [unclassified Rhizobium]MBB3391768.1 DNA-binding MarR family transcriptional regulator [Rhizobium sp. BK275]MBB3410177.1 DNA-binding MarR family transcriptional regulator [Rhizobium sp. BK316]